MIKIKGKHIDLDEKFVSFYWKIKKFCKDCKEHEFGNGRLPSRYTEGLCKALYKLEEYKGKNFDAQTKQYNYVEIKATLTKYGTTTISKKEFDILYWMYFDMKNNELAIYKIDYDELKKNIKNNKGDKRDNISLRKYVDSEKSDKFKFAKDKLYKITAQ